MSRPLTTACTTIANIVVWTSRWRSSLRFQQRLARILFGEDRGEIAILPLHADRMRVDVLAVRAELHLSAGTHRRIARGNVEGRERIADFLRIGRRRTLKRVGKHEGLRHQPAG